MAGKTVSRAPRRRPGERCRTRRSAQDPSRNANPWVARPCGRSRTELYGAHLHYPDHRGQHALGRRRPWPQPGPRCAGAGCGQATAREPPARPARQLLPAATTSRLPLHRHDGPVGQRRPRDDAPAQPGPLPLKLKARSFRPDLWWRAARRGKEARAWSSRSTPWVLTADGREQVSPTSMTPGQGTRRLEPFCRSA
jgi:hypothetical protein